MQTNYLKYFVDIADLGSISLAASKNFITSQGMSRSLSVLETELGCKLFDRTSNKVSLNGYGSVVLPLAKQMLALQDEMADRLSEVARQEADASQEDVVAYLNNVAFDASFFRPLASSFSESFRHARFYQCENARVVDNLIQAPGEEGGICLGLLCLFSPDEERNAALIGRLEDEGLTYQPYLHSHDQVLVSAKSPLAKKTALSRHDILSQPIISSGGDVGHAIELMFGRKAISMTTSDSSFRQKVVAEDGGIAFVPAFQQIFREDIDDGCVVVPMKDPYYFEIGFAGGPGVFGNPYVQRFFSRLNAIYLPYAETSYLALISSDLTLMRSEGAISLPVDKALCAIADRFGISPRERDVLELLAAGNTAAPIAERLFLSVSTVKSHIYSIYKKMGIHSQNELIRIVEQS